MREMKDSGLEWIGKIPKQWILKKIKYLGTSRNGLTYKPTDIIDETEGTLVLRSSNIQNGKLVFDDNVFVSCKIPKELKVQKDDILICSRNGSRELIGKNTLVNEIDATFGAFMLIYRCCAPHFLYYVLNSNVFKYYLGTFFTSTINQLTGTNFDNMKIAFCSNEEERKIIVDYLDEKCTDIDNITADIQRQIEVLQEYKQSVITEAVTKGLDKNVAMKDSGIEWIGNIPKNWSVKPIKYLYTVYSGATPKSNDIDNWDGDITWITPADFKTEDKYIASGSRNITTKGYKSCNTNLVPENSIIFSKRAPIGTVALSKGVLCTNQGCLACVNNDSSNSLYYYYLMSVLTEQFILYGSGTTFMEISTSNFENFKVVVPPKTEQDKISNYLDKKCNYIDATISDKQKQLDTLTEYKKSLIYEYVTGKKEVPADA